MTLAAPRRAEAAMISLKAAKVPALWPRWLVRTPAPKGTFTETVVPCGRYVFARFEEDDPAVWHRVRFLVGQGARGDRSWVGRASELSRWVNHLVCSPGEAQVEMSPVSDAAVAEITDRMTNDDGLMPSKDPVVEPGIGKGDRVTVGGLFAPPVAGTVRWTNGIGAHVDLAGGRMGMFSDGLFVEYGWITVTEKLGVGRKGFGERGRAPQFGRERRRVA